MGETKAHYCDFDASYVEIKDTDTGWRLFLNGEPEINIEFCPYCGVRLDDEDDLTRKTIAECLMYMRESGAGLYQQVIKNREDAPEAAIIIVDGAEETAEIIAAIDRVSEDW